MCAHRFHKPFSFDEAGGARDHCKSGASLALKKTFALICDIRKGHVSDIPAHLNIVSQAVAVSLFR